MLVGHGRGLTTVDLGIGKHVGCFLDGFLDVFVDFAELRDLERSTVWSLDLEIYFR